MNGPIAQLVALAGHINSVIETANQNRPRIWSGNSTFVFCDWVKFHTKTKGVFRSKSVEFANPDEWISWLIDNGCTGAWIWRGAINDPRISDRMSAGFVGGGGNWTVNTIMDNGKSMSWYGSWEVWNQEAAEQKIWRVDYSHIATYKVDIPEASLRQLSLEFDKTLALISDFACRIDAGGFAKCFEKAKEAIKGIPVDVYHNDLLPASTYSPTAINCIKACQSAWVFGGMGSWNDMWLDGSDQKLHEELSERCFSQLNSLIVASVNSAANKAMHTDASGAGDL